MFINIIGFLFLFKKFYKKVKPGEVIVVNTLEAKPKIVRSGTFVMPFIHNATNVYLNTRVIQIGKNSLDKINELYSLDIKTFSVQIINTDDEIIKAYERINEDMEALSSILEHAIQEGLLSIKNYSEFKKHLSKSLNNVGYEFVV